jgi:alkylation response protein AidB-like acyl-CoA dehydrogenase
MRTRARRDGDGLDPHGSKMWITNGSVADVAVVWARTDEGVRGFLVPRGTPGFTTQDIHRKLSLRASITSELLLDDVRLPADALLPEATSLRGPLSCLDEARFGIVFGAVGAARACFEAALDYSLERRAVRPADRLLPAPAGQARGHGRGGQPRDAARAAPGPHEGPGPPALRAREHGQARERQRGARGRPHGAPGARAPTA